jgi:hypothetical protein
MPLLTYDKQPQKIQFYPRIFIIRILLYIVRYVLANLQLKLYFITYLVVVYTTGYR